MSKALINKDIIVWALSRADATPDAVAVRLNVRPEVVTAWLEGSDRPTFLQAQKLADVLSIPFGYLYLPTPPIEQTLLPDFRTVGGEQRKMDINTKTLLGDVMFKRDWYKEYKELNGYNPIPFIKRYTLQSDPKIVAADMLIELHGDSARPKSSNYEDYLTYLMACAETRGIWVMRTGIVGSNTHRPLSVAAFRGMAIADPVIPLVLINGQDSTSAQIFTFAHELAHLWIGESGVSSIRLDEPDFGTRSSIEKFCNKVAAEFLTPEVEFRARWITRLSLNDQVDSISAHFKVSRIVVARRARDFGFISDDVYRVFYASEQQRWQILKDRKKSGGNFFNTLPIRNGKNFTRAVVQEAMRGSMLLRHAASLLGVQPGKLKEIYERM